MSTVIITFCNLTAVLITCIAGIKKYRYFDISLKVLVVFFVVDFFAEFAACLSSKFLHTNTAVYSVYNLIEILFISIYFNYSIKIFRPAHIGIWIGAISVLIGISDLLFLEPLDKQDEFLLFFESIVIIGLVLFSFARMMIESSTQVLTHNPHFWVGIAFLFFWSITFCNWAIYEYFYVHHPGLGWIADLSLVAVSLLTYIVFIIVFLYSPQWTKSNE